MPRDTITLRLSGDVFLDDFLSAIKEFDRLIGALGKDVAQGVEVEWNVDDLSGGSAVTTIRGIARDEERQPAVEEIVRAYEQVAISMERGWEIPYSRDVGIAAHALTDVLDGRIDEILLETDEMEAVITKPAGEALDRLPETAIFSYGAIVGRVQTLSSRTGLRFTLYDVFGRGIPCHLQKGDEELMRGAWDKWVVVEGRIRRDATGKPISIRKITNVEIREPGEPQGYRKARGVLRAGPNAPSPEEAIRRLRDAQ